MNSYVLYNMSFGIWEEGVLFSILGSMSCLVKSKDMLSVQNWESRHSPGHKSLPFYSLQSVSGTALAWIKPPFHIQSVTSLYTGRNTFTKINSLFYIFTTLHLVNMRAVPRTFALLVFISAIRPETQSWKENIVIFNFSWLRYFTFQMPARGAGWTNWTSKLNEISVICSVICFTPGIE